MVRPKQSTDLRLKCFGLLAIRLHSAQRRFTFRISLFKYLYVEYLSSSTNACEHFPHIHIEINGRKPVSAAVLNDHTCTVYSPYTSPSQLVAATPVHARYT